MTKKHFGLPVSGYAPQGQEAVDKVNRNKSAEEWVLRLIDEYTADPEVDKRWLAIAKTHIEEGFMAMNRAIFKPTRIALPGEGEEIL